MGAMRMDEKKISKIMIYKDTQVIWGDLVLNASINAAKYLQNAHQSSYISLENAKIITFSGNNPLQPLTYKDIHIPFQKILACHLLPPITGVYDTGSDVKQSKVEEVYITLGDFLFKGNLVFSNQLSFIQYIKRQSTHFITLSDVKIMHQTRKDFNKISTPFCFLKLTESIIGVQ